MSAAPRLVLVHGYTGSPETLAPLAEHLSARFGAEAVRLSALPGHGGAAPPPFEEGRLLAAVEAALGAGEEFVAVGHSTGGSLLLAALARLGLAPRLLVLAAVPKRVGAEALARWERSRPEGAAVSLTDGAALASFVNRAGRLRFGAPFPVFALQGEEEERLEPRGHELWAGGTFAGPVRTALVPGAGHPLFSGAGGALALDLVGRAVADAILPLRGEEEEALRALVASEPEVGAFLAASPSSGRHLARCPGTARVEGREPKLGEEVGTEPVFLNVEVTTRCNARCPHCARSLAGADGGEEMAPETFGRLLDLLPHAYRVTLVGLGEPLLHPEVVGLVREAARRGRRPALVTNGSRLTPSLGEALLGAGLRSIAFSVDALPPRSEELRPGPPFAEVAENLRAFMQLGPKARGVSTALFCALSTRNLDQLAPVADFAVELGVHVLMLSDLNFSENRLASLARNRTPELESAVRRGVAHAFSRGLPVLTVRGLEEFGLALRYPKALLAPAGKLYERPPDHRNCLSPWQTLAVDVRGDAFLCDCQPDIPLGNLFTQPLGALWNGEGMRRHRAAMRSSAPPARCGECPRF